MEYFFKKCYHTFFDAGKFSIHFIFTRANTRSLRSLEICPGKYENSYSQAPRYTAPRYTDFAVALF